jgi:hypothetical protein
MALKRHRGTRPVESTPEGNLPPGPFLGTRGAFPTEVRSSAPIVNLFDGRDFGGWTG